VEPQKGERWIPIHTTQTVSRVSGSRLRYVDLPYYINELEINECPMSYITEKSRRLVNIVMGMNKSHDQIGAIVNLDETPGLIVDAAREIHRQGILIENARIEAETAAAR